MHDDSYIQKHIDAILAHPLVDVLAIAKMNFKVVVDAVNSTGSISVPQVLSALGCDGYSGNQWGSDRQLRAQSGAAP